VAITTNQMQMRGLHDRIKPSFSERLDAQGAPQLATWQVDASYV
jgi:hypothetical protein